MDPTQQPNQSFPAPPSQSQQPGQYDFIMNPQKPKKKGLFSFGGGKSNILVTVIAAVGGLTLIILVGSMFFGGSSDKDTLLTVARKQSELIALAEIGADKAGSNQSQSFALSTKMSITTEQQTLVSQMAKREKVSAKDYADSVDSADETTLETAERNGRFDEVFNNLMKEKLTEYQRVLQTANSQVQGKTSKSILAESFKDTGLLLSISTS